MIYKNRILMAIGMFLFLADPVFAAWNCEAAITDSAGKIFQNKVASFKSLEEVDFYFPTDPDVTGEEVILFVNNSWLHVFGSAFYVSESLPKVEAMHWFSKGLVSLKCFR